MASLVANAAAAIQTIMGLAEKLPLVGSIAEGILYVKEVADTAEHNKKNCAKIAKRCDTLAVAVESCAREYAANGGPGEKQLLGLKHLRDGLARMTAVVKKHSKRGKVHRLSIANEFKEEFGRRVRRSGQRLARCAATNATGAVQRSRGAKQRAAENGHRRHGDRRHCLLYTSPSPRDS